MNTHRRVSQMAMSTASDQSQSPISRTGTPAVHHDPNIAPQNLFDGIAALQDPHYGAGVPTDPALQLNNPSPGVSTMTNGHVANAMSYDDLLGLTTSLRTRVSELEVINMVYHDNEQNLCRERDRAFQERDEYKRKAEDLEKQVLNAQTNDEHISKKPRLSPETHQ